MSKQLRITGVAFFLLLFAIMGAQAVEAKSTIEVVAERSDAIYKKGEQAKFLVTVLEDGKSVKDGTVSYILDDFGPGKSKKGTVKLDKQPAVILGTLSEPGVLRCRISYKSPQSKKAVKAQVGIAFSPEEIKLSMPVPDDFDEFWNEQKARLAKLPINPRLTPVKATKPNVESYDVQLDCLGGAPVSGYFSKPKGAKPKSLPAMLCVHGAGVRSSGLGGTCAYAANGMMTMDINAHGIPNGKPGGFYSKLGTGELKGYPHRGRESRDTCYFLGMYLRLVRAIDFLTSQPEWDGKTLAVVGHSQGGGQSLVAGGLDDRVTMIATGVPAMCDHSGVVAGRVNGWPKLVPNGPDGKPVPEILNAARYFDAVNFATRCKTEAIMSIGFVDGSCPPSSCYAAYNQLKGKKQVITKPLMGHAAPSDINKAFFDAIKAHAERNSGNKPKK